MNNKLTKNNTMASFVIMILGFNLIIISAAAYFASKHFSPTLFIPAIFGLLILVCASLRFKNPKHLNYGLYASTWIAFIGLIASGMRLSTSYEKIRTITEASPLAFYTQLSMATICLLVFLAGSYVYYFSKRYNANMQF